MLSAKEARQKAERVRPPMSEKDKENVLEEVGKLIAKACEKGRKELKHDANNVDEANYLSEALQEYQYDVFQQGKMLTISWK